MDRQIDQIDFIGSCTTKVKGPITKRFAKILTKEAKGLTKRM